MSSSGALDVPSAGLECPVCLDGFDEGDRKPKMLLCGHSLCQTCTAGLLRPYSCPVCRAKVRVTNLPTNFALLQLLPAKAAEALPKLRCEDCKAVATLDQAWLCKRVYCREPRTGPPRLLCSRCCIEQHSRHTKARLADAVEKELAERAHEDKELLATLETAQKAGETAAEALRSVGDQLNHLHQPGALKPHTVKEQELSKAQALLIGRVRSATGRAGAINAIFRKSEESAGASEDLEVSLTAQTAAWQGLTAALDGTLAAALAAPQPPRKRARLSMAGPSGGSPSRRYADRLRRLFAYSPPPRNSRHWLDPHNLGNIFDGPELDTDEEL